MCRPMRGRGSARPRERLAACPRSVSRAPERSGRATRNASPWVSTSTPPLAANAARNARRCSAERLAVRVRAEVPEQACQPSMSVKRNVAVPGLGDRRELFERTTSALLARRADDDVNRSRQSATKVARSDRVRSERTLKRDAYGAASPRSRVQVLRPRKRRPVCSSIPGPCEMEVLGLGAVLDDDSISARVEPFTCFPSFVLSAIVERGPTVPTSVGIGSRGSGLGVARWRGPACQRGDVGVRLDTALTRRCSRNAGRR